jgi:AsmA protein
MPRPVIANNIEPEYTSLRDFTAQVSLTANNIRWRGMRFDNVKGQFSNNAGLLNISTLQGKMGDGDISLPGMLDVRRDNSRAVFQPRLDNVEIGTILKAFNYPLPSRVNSLWRAIFRVAGLMPMISAVTGRAMPMSRSKTARWKG